MKTYRDVGSKAPQRTSFCMNFIPTSKNQKNLSPVNWVKFDSSSLSDGIETGTMVLIVFNEQIIHPLPSNRDFHRWGCSEERIAGLDSRRLFDGEWSALSLIKLPEILLDWSELIWIDDVNDDYYLLY